MEQPIGPVLRIIEERELARAKDALRQAKNPADVPNTPMVAFVKQQRTDGWAANMKALEDYQV